ncbi:PH domain containing protein, putative [Leishmania donovani]|uniref:PH domain containing protein, putative n=1 Tax=Leishmania donovani TaxID=5661 RepID=A0A3S7WQQ2_LEIDO|nr:PH domain containing protein, putative [Leishmania donovani]
MNSLQTSAADAAVACLRVLHRLLQDEEVTLAQLSYLIENVHDPLAHVCLPPSQRPMVVAIPQLSSPSASVLNRYSSPAKHAHPSVPSTMAAAAANEVKARRLPPQPAVVETAAPAPKEATPPKTAKSTGRMRKTSRKASRTGAVSTKASSSSSASRAEARVPLTFSQYWAIFANLPTLYTVHLTLVQQLDKVLLRLTQIVDELHPATQDTASSEVLHSSAAIPVPDAALNTRKHASALRNPSASPAAGARSVYNEIGIMVCEFFGSELMKHFMAEHMMYTVKYTQQAAPQLLRLSRLWRWCAESSGSSGVSAASLTHLSEMDQKTILQNDLFLDFLWRSFGPSGMPDDDRVCIPASPELQQRTAAGGQGQALPPARALAGGSGGARRSRPTAAASSPAAHLPPIPAMWEGFRTLLVLLATPLSILRRYSHVARCLVESGALLPNYRKRLQSCFVDVAALRISEETNLVVEELCMHDVRGIMALMDIPGASTNSGGSGGEPSNSGAVAALCSAGAPANHSSRVLIHYGRLLKRFGRGRHERLIFLFSDWMCYAEESSNGRFRVRGTMPLSGLRVVEARDDPSLGTVNCFELVLPSLSKRITLYAASPEQRDQWVDAIRYTVRRFEAQRQRQAATNGSARSSDMNTAAGDGGMPSVMRPTAPMLMSNSRLSRQRHNDIKWQAYGNLQRRTTEMAPQASHMISGAARVPLPAVAGGPVGGSSSFPVCHSPPPANIPSGDPSPNNSAVRHRSGSTHRHLDYNIAPWSARASVHRRIRSQELIAVHQQQLAVSSSHIATPTQADGAPPGGGGATVESNSNLNPMVVPALDTGNMDSASPVRAGDRNAPPQKQHSRQILSPIASTAAVAASTERRSSSSFHSFTIDIMVSSNRGSGGSGVSTPLRRPVSERFEAVKISSRGGNPPHQPLQETFALPEKAARHPGGKRVASSPASSSNSSSGVLDSVIGTAGPPTLVTDGIPASGEPLSASAGAQALRRADSGPPNKSVISVAKVPPTSVTVAEENNSRDSRPATAGDQSASGTGSVMSAAALLEQSVNGGAEEDDSMTATAVVTAFRSPGVIYHRLMTPTSPLVMESRPAAVPRESSDVPSPFRPIMDSSMDFDANVRKPMVAAEPLRKTVKPCHVDPIAKVSHGGDSDDGPVQS